MTAAIRDEILALRDDDELVHAQRMEAWAAQNPGSLLHQRLEWDNEVAGRSWRVEQCRKLIRIHVVDNTGRPQLVSLRIDRGSGGGYRDRTDVMNDSFHLDQLKEDCLAELVRLAEKYEFVREFRPVWRAIEVVQASWERRHKRRGRKDGREDRPRP